MSLMAFTRLEPVCRMWLVTKVVAIGTPSFWRKVLNCMAQIKFRLIWQIRSGAEGGSAPRKMTRKISIRTRSVSQRSTCIFRILFASTSERMVPAK